jgi:hypothetical protein
MNEHLRDRILRKLETLPDERGYQVLDYVEFLESKYAERASPSASTFTRFTEAIEDQLRAGRISASTIAETVGFMNRAANALNSALETGKTMASELVSSARSTSSPNASPNASPTAPSPPATGGGGSDSASSPARDIQEPGGSGEKL